MKPEKFFGITSREVLKKVRLALGDDALIVSNRPVSGGIEIMALAGNAFSEASPRQVERGVAAHSEPEGMGVALMREVNFMKLLLQRELTDVVWSNISHRSPARADMMQALLTSGFSPSLARQLIMAVAEHANPGEARAAVVGELTNRLPLARGEALIEQGGVFALVGPTGVGKTTTIAKLAARCVVRYGADSLALLTTDSYRIAAHDQLRIYGKILDVPVHAIKNADDLQSTLKQLRNKKTVLIDTVGMSQRDRGVADQGALLNSCGGAVKRLLLLNSTANAATLDEVVSAYSAAGVAGCIVTKVDESASLAPAVDTAIRHTLALHYVTNGQRVPEDLHLPNPAYLIDSSLRTRSDISSHGLQAEECSLLMGGAAQGAVYG